MPFQTVLVHWRSLLTLTILLFSTPSYAVDQVSVKLGSLNAKHWSLQQASLSLQQRADYSQSLNFKAERLVLTQGLDAWQFIDIRCEHFVWQQQLMDCSDGQASLKVGQQAPIKVALRFKLSPLQGELHIDRFQLVKGSVNFKLTEQQAAWNAELNGQAIDLIALQKYLGRKTLQIKKGQLNVQIKSSGTGLLAGDLGVKLQINNTTLQDASGQHALDSADLALYLNAQAIQEGWDWQSHTVLSQGALYIDPLYIKAPVGGLAFDSVGHWSPAEDHVQVDYFQYLHPGVASLNGSAHLRPKDKNWLRRGEFQLQASDLKSVSTLYNSPFWVGTAFEGLTLSGQLLAKLSVEAQSLQSLQLDVDHLGLIDPKKRFGLQGVQGHFQWHKAQTQAEPGFLSWRRFEVYAIPFGATQLDFTLSQNRLALLKPVNIELLGGALAVHEFIWQSQHGQPPEIHFSAALQNASLDTLTERLQWPALSGNLSGDIPGVHYQNNRLDLEGVLKAQVFAGEVEVKKLAVANLLSDVPKFYSDISFKRLNLEQLTGKFKFGGIEGLLSGYINDLYLENWHPVSFYAWLGTPDDDNSRHRISQKAVDNIAKIGGNGATDLISRSVLGFFDTFGYEQLGMGCYLHAGVCQLMGVAAANNGYYLIKGGGMPRIDVIGYNPRVDWKVLVERLGRINQPSEVIVK